MKVIAETAFNHNGDIDYLIELITEAKNSGADYVTVQVMDTKSFCDEYYERYKIYIDNEISKSDWKKIFGVCNDIGLELIPCVLDESSFTFCYEEGFRFFKLHATDITNKYFLEKIAKTDCSIILETQCASNFDIRFALNILNDKVKCLIHGFSDYPTEMEDINLNALDAMYDEYKIDVGFADHTLDIEGIPLMCLSKGIKFLEKHITLSRQNRNFDWQVSLYPQQFSSMVSNIKHYETALGLRIKHPTKRELSYRSVLYKKYINEDLMMRADKGDDFIGNYFSELNKSDVGVSVIARLKSTRLKKKVLKKFNNDEVIVDLCNRVKESEFPVVLTTSNLKDDDELVEVCEKNDISYYRGHPISVLDRMLSLAFDKKWGGIFRVTGDNPLTDPKIMMDMVTMFNEEDLDYVRVDGLPFGVSTELFSVSYLWKLYLNMDNPLQSEYLSWFVLNDDDCRRGCIDVNFDDNLKYINLSIDYEEDYRRCIKLLKNINKSSINEITLKDICTNIDLNDFDIDKEIKLPNNISISLKKYLEIITNCSYINRRQVEII
jgi:N,N'-diacetyllegionaminate synthase